MDVMRKIMEGAYGRKLTEGEPFEPRPKNAAVMRCEENPIALARFANSISCYRSVRPSVYYAGAVGFLALDVWGLWRPKRP